MHSELFYAGIELGFYDDMAKEAALGRLGEFLGRGALAVGRGAQAVGRGAKAVGQKFDDVTMGAFQKGMTSKSPLTRWGTEKGMEGAANLQRLGGLHPELKAIQIGGGLPGVESLVEFAGKEMAKNPISVGQAAKYTAGAATGGLRRGAQAAQGAAQQIKPTISKLPPTPPSIRATADPAVLARRRQMQSEWG